RLMTEQYACVARCDHPRLGDSLSMHEFLAEEYVSVDAPATVHARLDKVLEERGIERKVKIKVSSLLGIGQMITSTNLLAILPSRVARTLEHDASIKVLKLPFSLPSYDVCQYWHEPYHHEPGHIWLRQTIFETFLDMPLPAQRHARAPPARLAHRAVLVIGIPVVLEPRSLGAKHHLAIGPLFHFQGMHVVNGEIIVSKPEFAPGRIKVRRLQCLHERLLVVQVSIYLGDCRVEQQGGIVALSRII